MGMMNEGYMCCRASVRETFRRRTRMKSWMGLWRRSSGFCGVLGVGESALDGRFLIQIWVSDPRLSQRLTQKRVVFVG